MCEMMASITVAWSSVLGIAVTLSLFFAGAEFQRHRVAVRQAAWVAQRKSMSVARHEPSPMIAYLDATSEDSLRERQAHDQLQPRKGFAGLAPLESFIESKQVWNGLSLLCKPEWIPTQPILITPDLGRTQLRMFHAFEQSAIGDDALWRPRSAMASRTHVLPPQSHRRIVQMKRYERYSEAMTDLAPPGIWEDRICYRIESIDFRTSPSVTLGLMHYFDFVDEGQALDHEWFAVAGKVRHATLRRQVGNPVELSARASLGAVTAITILDADTDNPRFLVFDRNSDNVASSAGKRAVVPSGVFQPASVAMDARSKDANFWNSVVREYAEELLGAPEARYLDNLAISYQTTEPYDKFWQAEAKGGFSLQLLGAGVNPYDLAVEFLFAGVFAREASSIFDFQHLAGVWHAQREGDLLESNGHYGFPFNEDFIAKIENSERHLQSASLACIRLAWRWRELLLPSPATS